MGGRGAGGNFGGDGTIPRLDGTGCYRTCAVAKIQGFVVFKWVNFFYIQIGLP